jgi:hypothetical protein
MLKTLNLDDNLLFLFPNNVFVGNACRNALLCGMQSIPEWVHKQSLGTKELLWYKTYGF